MREKIQSIILFQLTLVDSLNWCKRGRMNDFVETGKGYQVGGKTGGCFSRREWELRAGACTELPFKGVTTRGST